MTRIAVVAAGLISATVLSGCIEANRPKGTITDKGSETAQLVDGLANVWVDPDGCQHWYIDDGVEGYMTPRLNPNGTPVCNGRLVAKDGTVISDG